MSQHPDDRTQGEPRDPEGETWSPDHDQDLHPAIDPRESTEPVDGLERPEAPPVDIDDREAASTSRPAPEVIELSEHVDVAGEDTAFETGRADEDQVASHEISDEPGEEATNGMGDDAIAADDGPAVKIEDSWGDPIPPPGVPDSEGGIESGDVENLGSPGRETADPTPSATLTSRASSRLAGAASRLGLGKLLDTTEETDQEAEDGPGGTDQSATSGSSRSGSRMAESVRSYLDPRLHMFSTIPHRRVLAAGIVLVLFALLANSGGLALIVLSAIVPILIVITLTQHDVFEKESNLLVAAVGAGARWLGSCCRCCRRGSR